ncbi:LOW QUALITY PROTEIN: coiled-coil domain-containing protein 153 [Rissa tridactyla]|uniref:LOW QUALITY PROTEIN: coiled-coil domain-containing protein 153 n=1 Tax=Rissa tridactyla TaxID=75485 RepID=UPI0023BAADD0|nr:LOW QUALITY PROTEIN: coiled-coil domain-containing protein 153 [Rissa tridactyla]
MAEKERNNDESRWEVVGMLSPVRLQLAVSWRYVTWQAKADNEVLQRRLWAWEKALEQARKEKRDIREEMTWQYQELQKQTAAHSQCLEAKVIMKWSSFQFVAIARLLCRHAQCPLLLSLCRTATRLQESQKAQETASQALAERDRTIAQLQGKLYAMEREYEKILHGSLDLVLAKTEEASQDWEEVGTTIAVEHKECLQEFSLSPLEM